MAGIAGRSYGRSRATGEAGEDGKSAYELAVENGFEGSLEEWLTSLVGSSGEDGTDEKLGNAFRLGWPAVAFVLAVLSLFNLIPSPILAACMLVFLLIADRDSLKKVDYSLLITFIALFIFIGNIGRIPEFRSFLSGILEGRVTIMGVALSQIISNVPAALLLTGFTSEWREILIGVNLGGLGTLIASMASLISYKAIAKEYPNAKGKYILRFTVFNVAFLGVLIGMYYLITALWL